MYKFTLTLRPLLFNGNLYGKTGISVLKFSKKRKWNRAESLEKVLTSGSV